MEKENPECVRAQKCTGYRFEAVGQVYKR